MFLSSKEAKGLELSISQKKSSALKMTRLVSMTDLGLFHGSGWEGVGVGLGVSITLSAQTETSQLIRNIFKSLREFLRDRV